jgi:hypothetical protein
MELNDIYELQNELLESLKNKDEYLLTVVGKNWIKFENIVGAESCFLLNYNEHINYRLKESK